MVQAESVQESSLQECVLFHHSSGARISRKRDEGGSSADRDLFNVFYLHRRKSQKQSHALQCNMAGARVQGRTRSAAVASSHLILIPALNELVNVPSVVVG